MDESSHFDASGSSPEVQFAKVLENFRLAGPSVDPFAVSQNFISICAARALAVGKRLSEAAQLSPADAQEFESWDLETKLWHLVTILYSFRLSDKDEQPPVHGYASLSAKQSAYLHNHPKLQELLLIIQWIQHNSQDVSVPDASASAEKWNNTKIALENKNLASLTSSAPDYVDHLDADAPLRSQKNIAPADFSADATNFGVVYDLLLAGELQRAVDYASETGNFTLALILVGASQDYVDPVVDQIDPDSIDEDVGTEPFGVKHKYLWLQTVHKLSQSPSLPREEALIYSYLAGADQTENIKQAGENWDQCLLLYVNQLLTHHVRTFIKSSFSETESAEELSNTSFPTPQHASVDSILNTMAKSAALEAESKNPFRVIMGSVLIDQLIFFLHNTFKSSSELVEDQHILRVLTHLAVFASMLNLHEGSKAPTKIITKYISKLSDYGYEDLVPIYLTFIPDEKDVRECYSIFLTTITDPAKRAKQLEIFKRLGITTPGEASTPASSSTEELVDDHEYKIHNVLKRTVERVMVETEPHYLPTGDIVIEDVDVDSTDTKLYRAVEWFYENNMYEDAIHATITVFRRFLATGRLKAIKEFGRGKNFKSLLKNYDMDLHSRSLGDSSFSTSVSEADKDELIQFDVLLDCLNILEEWKSFVGGATQKLWKSRDVDNSIKKTTSKIQKFIFSWFQEAIASASHSPEQLAIYKEYRSIYVPYFTIELLQILNHSRQHDWKYMREAFQLVNEVANDKDNDLLQCFIACGRIREFVSLVGEVSVVATEKGIKGVFA